MMKEVDDFNFAIIMKFMRVWPSINVIQLNVVKKWGPTDISTIKFLDDYHVALIQMWNEHDFVHG